MYSPIPVPFPSSFVVTFTLNRVFIILSGTPPALSVAVIIICELVFEILNISFLSKILFSIKASLALLIKFIITCLNSVGIKLYSIFSSS